MSNYKEDLFHFIWQYKLLKTNSLRTESGQELEIIKPGELNFDSGPDFFNAKIKLEKVVLAGNIEVHVNASDWQKHNHQNDAAYSNIILHVVYQNDLKEKSTGNFEVLELKKFMDKKVIENYKNLVKSKNAIACQKQIANVNPIKLNNWLERMLIERLEKKTDYIKEQFHNCNNDYSYTFYITLAKNFGFKVNAEPFENLARVLPLSILLKHADNLFQIEAFLFGCAGMLDKSYKDKYLQRLQNEFEFLKQKYQLHPLKTQSWKFMRLRPANFPSVRLWQFAKLIHFNSDIFSNPDKYNSIERLTKALQHQPDVYWKTHYNPGGKEQKEIGAMGINSIENIMINTMAPFLFFYAKQTGKDADLSTALECFEGIAFESNVKTRHFTKAGLKLKTAADSQALINLFDNYCKTKRCLKCGIASQLLINS